MSVIRTWDMMSGFQGHQK
ncbi:hypothetical protein LINPERHAP1_LOCUS31867 [Linum perenne]